MGSTKWKMKKRVFINEAVININRQEYDHIIYAH